MSKTTHHSPLTPHSSSSFVILHHRAPQGEHWDLMLERGGSLSTWQLLADPRLLNVWPIAARRIGNHRLAYLTYEGPLSGDRGEVTRIEQGVYEILTEGPQGLDIRLQGGLLAGRFELRPFGEADAIDLWRFAALD